MAPAQAREIVTGLTDRDVVNRRFAWHVRALHLTHFADPEPIAELLAEHLPERFEDLRIPLTVAATNMGAPSPYAQYFFRGARVRSAVLASLSIPGVWPYVAIEGIPHADGGLTDAVVVPSELETFDEFYVINVERRRESYRKRDRNIISRLWGAVEILADTDVRDTRERIGGFDNVHWLDLDMGSASCLDFDHGLIESARTRTLRWLADTDMGRRTR